MKSSPWSIDGIEIEIENFPNEDFDHLLDEWAEMVYRYLCQLREKDSLVPETSLPLTAERTGTDE